LKKLIHILRQYYRLLLSPEKKKEVLWKELKKFFNSTGYNVGIHEKKKYVELHFKLDDNERLSFFYHLDDGLLFFRAVIISPYPNGVAEDLFILSAHFTNLMKHGVVVVDVNNKEVEYLIKIDQLNPLLDPEIIDDIFHMHYNSSSDVLYAFNRLIREGEAPAIIIADLLKAKEKGSDK
jgi:hypothetical protein